MATSSGEIWFMKKIYILHGWAYKTTKWQPFLDLLNKNGFSPILLKTPGLTQPLQKAWNIDDYVQWLHQEIGKEKDVILLGHSFGGRICVEYCLKYPNKVTTLFLIDSAGVFHNEILIRLKRFVFNFLAKFGKKVTSSTFLRSLLYKFARENDYNQANPNMKKVIMNMTMSDKLRNLDVLITPTVLIWGEYDKTTPLSDGYYLNTKIKNSKLFIVNNARHSPHFTHPQIVFDYIKDTI